MSTDRHSSSFVASPEETNLFLDILQEAPLCGHRKRTRIVGSIFYCILLAGYAIFAVGATWILRSLHEIIILLLCSGDIILLVTTGIFQQYLVYQVQKIRLQGYYGFSQKLKHVIRLPFATIAYGTAAMLLVMAWKPHISILSISMLLRIIMLVEAVCAGFFMSVYIGYVLQYNSLDSQPDVLNSLYSPLQQSSPLEGLRCLFMDWSGVSICAIVQAHLIIIKTSLITEILKAHNLLEAFGVLCADVYTRLAVDNFSILNPHSTALKDLGYHDGGRLSDQQMALLQYQRENLHFLSEEILRLQECLSKYERSDDGSTPQVDLAHLLATRDQELRTLSAEMNQLQSELRLARSLIAERDSEIQRVRNTNNQYIEENERLRAILGEWSNRAAKLERALEAEQMSNLELQKKIASKSEITREQGEPAVQLNQ